MTFTTVDNRFKGTELMVRKLLADRLFLTKEEQNPTDKTKIINWLTNMTIHIRLVVDKSVQAKQPKGLTIRDAKGGKKFLNKNGDVKAGKKGKGHAYTVQIWLINIPHKNDKNDLLNIAVELINNNGAATKWHMVDAANWFKRAMPKVGYAAVIETFDGFDLSSAWGDPRKRKLDRDFFLVSGSQLNANAGERDEKADTMMKYNLLRASMYRFWAKNLRAAVRFYDAVRTA